MGFSESVLALPRVKTTPEGVNESLYTMAPVKEITAIVTGWKLYVKKSESCGCRCFTATGFDNSPFKPRESQRLQSDLDYLNTAHQVFTKIKPQCCYLEIKMDMFRFYVGSYSQLSHFLSIHVIVCIVYQNDNNFSLP